MFLPAPVAFVLAAIGGVLAIVQEVAISMSAQAHSIVAFSIIVIVAFGVVPLSADALRRLIPAHVAAILTTAAGILAALQQTFGVSPVVHSIILFVMTFLATLGIVPAISTVPQAAETLRRKTAALKEG